MSLDMLRMVADDSRIVYGSDYPHSPAKVICAKKRHLDENEKYNGLCESIYWTNGVRLLNGGHLA